MTKIFRQKVPKERPICPIYTNSCLFLSVPSNGRLRFFHRKVRLRDSFFVFISYLCTIVCNWMLNSRICRNRRNKLWH